MKYFFIQVLTKRKRMRRRVDDGESNRPPLTAADLFNSNQAYEAQQEATVGSWRMAVGDRRLAAARSISLIHTYKYTYRL